MDLEFKILEYLNDNDTGQLISLNERLIELTNNKELHNVNHAIRALDGEYIQFEGDISIIGGTRHGTYYDLLNTPLKAKIKDRGKSKLEDYYSKFNQDELTRQQLSDLPANSMFRKRGYYVALISLIALLLLWLIDKYSKK